MTRLLTVLGMLLMACANVGHTLAQNYPNRPLRIIVPFPAGGGVDTMARILAQRMTDVVKQPVLVEHKPVILSNEARDVAALRWFTAEEIERSGLERPDRARAAGHPQPARPLRVPRIAEGSPRRCDGSARYGGPTRVRRRSSVGIPPQRPERRQSGLGSDGGEDPEAGSLVERQGTRVRGHEVDRPAVAIRR